MSGPQVVPSAAGMNLVSHRCPARWHQSDLQMSCQTNQTQMKGWFTTDVLSPLDAPPATPAVCQEHHHGTVGQALIPGREASPRSPDVRSNHCASLMKAVITVWAIWAKNKETQHTRERRGRAGVERLAAAAGNLPKWNWQQDRNWRGGECVFVP